VEATVWAMSAAEALLLDRSLRFSEHETALGRGVICMDAHAMHIFHPFYPCH
jgi:hypothetical protein